MKNILTPNKRELFFGDAFVDPMSKANKNDQELSDLEDLLSNHCMSCSSVGG